MANLDAETREKGAPVPGAWLEGNRNEWMARRDRCERS